MHKARFVKSLKLQRNLVFQYFDKRVDKNNETTKNKSTVVKNNKKSVGN